METIRVNMTPCEDVQTIHASQNDNEAREWGFELHNNGDKIDSSSISDQLVFKAYEGGTEEILPTNGSTPTTSPFKGDIKYPQGLLSDQEFLYRESPTEEDGNAKIESLYGKTLVWNQLAEVALPSTSASGITMTNNYDGSFTLNGTATAQVDLRFDQPSSSMTNLKNYPSAKYLFVCDNISSSVQFIIMSYPDYVRMATFTSSPFLSLLPVTGRDNCFMLLRVANGTTLNNVRIRPQFFNLTAIFGEGNEPSTVEEFTSLFPLPYYAYNQGTLLSFNGNGIKTVGKNLFNSADALIGRYVNDANGVIGTESSSVATNYIEIFPNTEYRIISAQTFGMWGAWYDANKTFISGFANYATVKTSPSNAKYMAFTISYSRNNQDYANNVMLLFNGEDETFEPYTSSTLSLPISTYFPSGMKSAGCVYDELTETKAITRIGMVDLGSLEWTYSSTFQRFSSSGISTEVLTPSSNARVGNILSSIYTTTSVSRTVPESRNDDMLIAVATSGNIIIVNESYGSDATALKTAMSGVYLYYELKTPTETSFTTASLVTENAEIPLSNEDGVLIGKCTEQLSENQGFFDAKIKLSDADGECYSNKIQLHVERSPQ